MQDSYDSGIDNSDQRRVYISQVVDTFIDHCYNNLFELFPKEQEQSVADAVLTIFKTRQDLDVFKKKALYIYIREMTDCETPTLTRVINRLKDEYTDLAKSYIQAGVVVEYKPSEYL